MIAKKIFRKIKRLFVWIRDNLMKKKKKEEEEEKKRE
jgi:hypothetical protein